MDKLQSDRLIPMKVLDADGAVRSLLSITNDIDDIGNAIAEGRMVEADRFIELSRRYNVRFVRAEKELYDERERSSCKTYSFGWIERFLMPWHEVTNG
jgi:hypothetical protein